jgi:hypothetical protein
MVLTCNNVSLSGCPSLRRPTLFCVLLSLAYTLHSVFCQWEAGRKGSSSLLLALGLFDREEWGFCRSVSMARLSERWPCISDMLGAPYFPKLPFAENPVEENRKIAVHIAGMQTQDVPMPFLLAIPKQEKNLKHFNEPRSGDGRGRDAGYPAPPAQIPACATNALASCLR